VNSLVAACVAVDHESQIQLRSCRYSMQFFHPCRTTTLYNTIQWVFLERRDVYAGWVQRRLGRLHYVLRVKGSCEQCGFQSFSLDLKMAMLSVWWT